jgi:hypothetical protein
MLAVYLLIAVWILAVVPAVVGHRRAHRADALVSFAAFQARGRTLTAPSSSASSVAARRQRVAGVFLFGLAASAVLAVVVQETWSTAVAAGMLHVSVCWYAAVVRSQVART